MKIRYITTLTVIAFLAHLVWENSQAPLYAGFQSFTQHFLTCLIGVVGDVVITFLVLLFVLFLKKDLPRTTADFIAIAVIGFMVAVIFEQNALLSGKWGYAASMPLIPYFQVGLTPILQMVILLPLSFYLAKLFNKKIYENI